MYYILFHLRLLLFFNFKNKIITSLNLHNSLNKFLSLFFYSMLEMQVLISRIQDINIISVCKTFKSMFKCFYFYFFMVFVSSKIFTGFAVLLYRPVVGFLFVPYCEPLAFCKSLSMVKKNFKFGMQSNKGARN